MIGWVKTAVDTRSAEGHKPPAPFPTDLAALATLVPRVTAMAVGALIVLRVARGAGGAKAWDKAMFAATIVLAAFLCVQFLVRPPRRAAGIVVSVLASGGLIFGIARVERTGEIAQLPLLSRTLVTAFPKLYWEGFGLPVAIVTVCLAVVLWRALDRIEASRFARGVLTAGIAAIAIVDVASLIRTLSSFADPNNNVYELNEMLAPAAGKVPDANFVPQYAHLYGWLLVPLRHVLSPSNLARSAVVFLSLLGVLSVVLAVTIAYRSMSSSSWWVAAGIVIPLTCVTVLHGATPFSSIGSYTQELPIRLFPAMLLSFLGLEELARHRAGSVRTWHLPALGALAGLIAWNSQDFGIAVVVAYSMLLAVALPAAQRGRSFALWSGGLVVGLGIYPLITALSGTPLRLDELALFSRTFAGGAGATLIRPGPVLVVFPLILASVCVGWCLVWRLRRRVPADAAPNDRAILTLALVGTWTLAGFVYYLNRSYASAQLQILLMPCGVCAVALVSVGQNARARRAQSGNRRSSRESLRLSFALFPAALLVALGFASMLQSPSPVHVVKDLTDPPADYGFTPYIAPLSTFHAAEAYVRTQGGSLGYFDSNGSYIHLVTGIPDLLLYDDLAQLHQTPALLNAGCRYLAAHSTTWLILSASTGPGRGQDICGLYHPAKVVGLPPVTLYRRNT
jgi:hypothetical protein